MSGSSDYTTTTNLGLFKPNYDMDDGEWGGHLNTNADTLDSAIHALQTTSAGVTSWNTRTGAVTLTTADVTTVLPASTTPPLMDGTAAVGTVTAWARADHIHPTDSTRASVASVPLASATTPAMDGTAAVGTGTTFARADHVHASDTSRYAASNPSGYQTAAQVAATVGNYLPLAGGTLSGNLTGPNLTATAAVAASAVFFGQPGVTDFYANASGNIRALSWRAGAYGLQFDNSTGTLTWIGNSATAATLDFGGNLTITGANAIKAGGGSWAAPSDDRLKRNVADYGAGLAEVIRLRPVSFEYNGAGGVKADGATYYGLSAQATQPVMPELVKETPAVGADGKRLPDLLDGQLVTDLGPLTLALVNAVRELSERIEALETPAAKEA